MAAQAAKTGERGFTPSEHFMKMRGQDYLPIKWRVVWFREDHPDGSIQTSLVSHDSTVGRAEFQARASFWTSDGREVSATGHGSETRTDFSDYFEKAETKAIGRALAMLGYGTQFAIDLDEGVRLADSPAERQQRNLALLPTQPTVARTAAPLPTTAPIATDELALTRLRQQVDTLLTDDSGAQQKLPKPVAEMTTAEAEKTLAWLRQRVQARTTPAGDRQLARTS